MISKSKNSEVIFNFNREYEKDSISSQIKRKSEEIDQYLFVLKEISQSLGLIKENVASNQL